MLVCVTNPEEGFDSLARSCCCGVCMMQMQMHDGSVGKCRSVAGVVQERNILQGPIPVYWIRAHSTQDVGQLLLGRLKDRT
jgi:hypothetical protein